ncbi:hypothetical protein J6590_087255 [Homalodisca vitripennis]|nr:hypothetical protein J6590_087255 [Homalodisca vitripennis]
MFPRITIEVQPPNPKTRSSAAWQNAWSPAQAESTTAMSSVRRNNLLYKLTLEMLDMQIRNIGPTVLPCTTFRVSLYTPMIAII